MKTCFYHFFIVYVHSTLSAANTTGEGGGVPPLPENGRPPMSHKFAHPPTRKSPPATHSSNQIFVAPQKFIPTSK